MEEGSGKSGVPGSLELSADHPMVCRPRSRNLCWRTTSKYKSYYRADEIRMHINATRFFVFLFVVFIASNDLHICLEDLVIHSAVSGHAGLRPHDIIILIIII